MIVFEVDSDSPADKELVARYWAMNEDGEFLEKVSDLLPYGGMSKSHQLLKYISDISLVWVNGFTCQRCAGRLLVRSRSDVKFQSRLAVGVCDSCQEYDKLERAQREKAAAAELNEKLEEVTQRHRALTIDYRVVQDDVALILLALDNALNPRLITGTFRRDECRGLAPSNPGKFIEQLRRAGALVDLPDESAPGAYFLKDGKLWLDSGKVAYSLVADKALGKSEKSINVLRTRKYRQFPLIRQLWLDYALSDCVAYLHAQCALHELAISEADYREVSSILRTALETYSVAQLWSVVWKVVRNTDSLFAGRSNSAKATATIPSKIRRYLEYVAKDKVVVEAWDRPADQPAGTLGDLLYEHFEVDEKTPGPHVMAIFADPDSDEGNNAIDPPAEVIEDAARIMMRQALAQDLGAAALLFFADCIRGGDDAKAALDAVFSAYPALAESLE